MATATSTTFFWQPRQPHDLRIAAQKLLVRHFGDNPTSFKIGLVVADIIKENNAAQYESKTTQLEREVWLHETIFKITSPLVDPHRELITGHLGTLSQEIEALANLLGEVNLLKAKSKELKTKEQFDTISRRATVGS